MHHILSRFIQMLVVLFILSFVIFHLIEFMPGDATSILKAENPKIKPHDLERLIKQRGLDKPSYIRYFFWLKRIIQGELGYSFVYKVKVEDMVGGRILTTLKLTIPTILITLLIALPIGILSALKQYSFFDYFINTSAFIGFSVPTFVWSLIAIFIFSQNLNLFPPGGMGTPGMEGFLNFDLITYIILPIAVLSFYDAGPWVRYVRATMLDVIKQDYIRTARAKGLPEDVVIIKHAVRNILMPFVTLVALHMPALFSGTLIVETVFGIPGMGRLLYDSVMKQDSDVAMSAFLLIAFMTLLFNFIADVIYTYIDPRIRYKK